MGAFWGLLGFDAVVLATAEVLAACGVLSLSVRKPPKPRKRPEVTG